MRSFAIYRATFWSNIIRVTKPRQLGSAGYVAQRRKKSFQSKVFIENFKEEEKLKIYV